MATELHHLSDYDVNKVPDASNMCFGIVVSEWNPEITDALLEGAMTTLQKHGTLPENIHVRTVPGSFELIYGAHQMVLHGGYDAVIILGSVIRGETPHFDYICQGVTEGIARLNATQEIPVIYGLLTTNDLQQAKDRAEGDNLLFAASVGSPDKMSDEYIPLLLKVSRQGKVSISKDTQLDTGSSEASEQDLSEEEGM